MIPKKRGTFLGEILVSAGVLTEEGLERGLELQRETRQLLGDALVSLGLVTREDIEWALSSQYQLPMIRPRDINVDRGAKENVPEPLAREFNVAPLFRTGNELSLVIDDPLRIESLSELEVFEGLDLNLALASPDDVRELIDDLYGTIGSDPAGSERPPIESTRLASEDVTPLLRDFTGGKFVEFLLHRAVAQEATSISLQPGEPVSEIRIRTGSGVHETFTLRSDWYRAVIRKLRALTGRADGGADRPVEGSGRVHVSNETIVFSVRFVPGEGGETALVKLPVRTPALPDLRDLRLPEGSVEKIALLLARGFGLWIVSGPPTPSSSRMLHALLQPILGHGRRILSLREDSRGYETLPAFRNMRILEAGCATDSHALPESGEWDGVVLPSLFHRGEIEQALRYALCGRMVLASMEFPDPRSVLRFLLCHGINAELLASALSGILVQKEIRILCSHCKKPVDTPSGFDLPLLGEVKETRRYRPVGCEVCRYSGFASRETLLDFWPVDAGLKRVMLGKDPLLHLEDYGRSTLERDCVERFRRGETVLEDVLSVCEI